jgi:toxin CptA
MNAASAVALALAFACAALMGYAIQRGATCMVAAVNEWLLRRSLRRLRAMAEASLWVAGGLVVAATLGLLPSLPAGYALSGWTVAGGVLLGLGAWVNGACVFGAVARLGSGEWAYAATPPGYLLGCLAVSALAPPPPMPLADASPLFAVPAALAVAFVLYASWRVLPPLFTQGVAALRGRTWQPHTATIVIGVTFFFTLVLAGAWAYTDLLADLARGRLHDVGLRLTLFFALLAGAAWGGISAGRWRPTRPAPAPLARCLAGGALMGAGTLLIPGSNDGLVLVGLPLLRPYAWVAFATMCLTIALAEKVSRRQARPASPKSSHFDHGASAGDGAA